MNYATPFGLLLSFVLLVGCTSTTDTAAVKDAPACASCAIGEKCATCATGEKCDKCAGENKKACADCAAGEKCADCAAKDAKCATCAAGEKCTECAGEAKEACATCAAGEACAECAAKKDKASNAAPAATTGPVATIEAKGMGCPLCASSADRRLMKVDGVTWTKIDLGNGQVTVGLDPKKPTPSAEELQTAIRDAGFTAEAVTLPAEGAGQ